MNQLPKPFWSCYLVSVRESASYQAVPALPMALSARIYAGCRTVQTDERRMQPTMLSQMMTRKMKTNKRSSELIKKQPDLMFMKCDPFRNLTTERNASYFISENILTN